MTRIGVDVIGDYGVGKTTLIISSIHKHYVEEYDPTITDSYRKQYCFDQTPILFELLDFTGGRCEEYDHHFQYRNTQISMICFSISDPASFENATSKWMSDSRDHTNNPVLLVGCKADLRSVCREQGKPFVSEDEARVFAETFGLHYLEVSSKVDFGIEKLFPMLMLTLLDHKDTSSTTVSRKKRTFFGELSSIFTIGKKLRVTKGLEQDVEDPAVRIKLRHNVDDLLHVWTEKYGKL